MRITIEIPDEELKCALAPLLNQAPAVAEERDGPAPPRLMRMAEAAEQLSVSRSTLYQLVARGAIRSLKIGRQIRIPRQALSEFIAEESRQRVDASTAMWSVPLATPAPRRVRALPVAAPPAVSARMRRQKVPKPRIDLSPRPLTPDPRPWPRDDMIQTLKEMEGKGWPADLTELILNDRDARVSRIYVLRAADLAELLGISRSTAGAMIKRGQIQSFSPEPAYSNSKPETLVSVLEYQRFIDAKR